MTANIHLLFSKVLYVKKINIDCNQILNIVKKQTWSVSGLPRDKNNKQISLASKNKKVLDDVKYKNLKKEIMKEFYEYAHKILNYTNNEFKMTTSWFTKTYSGQETGYHNHNNCMFSGVLYLKINENSGGINFNNQENFRFLLEPSKYDILNGRDFTIEPKVGHIIFFPSEVYHKILPSKSNEERISLAFNFLPVGKIGGVGDSQAYIE